MAVNAVALRAGHNFRSEYHDEFDVGTDDAGAATTRNEVDVAGDRALSSESLDPC